ncbi:type I polyketide synthase [Nocardioides speluncae]|uniref:type I polyketide synthase n=1 Tax=Nocardioides speluncae TaxID=2670337 RepID=UPI000D687E55|nr:type I polyketide synthase [Nocardioides speluncae]
MTESATVRRPADADSADSAAEPAVEPIAIIGMACRVPGAADVEEFWRNLVDGVESMVFTDKEEHRAAGAPDEEVDDPGFVPVIAEAADLDSFDAGYFGMTPREAQVTDPQHRLFLELAASALQDAGYDPERYPGDIGVYGGSGDPLYAYNYIERNKRILELTPKGTIHIGNGADYLATSASYLLGLRGPSMSVYAACSTSGVAMHLACEALRGGECDMALAGGASMEFPPRTGHVAIDGAPESSDGHVRSFDAEASGTVWSSGGGMVLLKRLSDALADGDDVRAVVVGNAINNDGSAKMSFTAPSPEGQVHVIRQALAVADVDPRTIGLVEAHGTATKLGDPIEVSALIEAFTGTKASVAPTTGASVEEDDESAWCAIGSVKSNLGHLSQAAAVVGMIKAVLCLQNATIVQTLNFKQPNPEIPFAGSPFRVATDLTAWPDPGHPRRAGVSSFGFGGTNAHFVLEAAPAPDAEPAEAASEPAHLYLSARDETALDESAARLADHLEAYPSLALSDVAHTLRHGRRELRHRRVLEASSVESAVAALRSGEGSRAQVDPAVRLAFLYPGQGSQHVGMGAALYEREPVFRSVIDECAEVLRPELDADLREVMFRGAAEEIRQTQLTQPLLFVVEHALAEQWASWGLRPHAAIGHSVGEYVAAVQAGVFALPDALRLVAARGRMMQGLPPGSMLAVQLPEDAVREHLSAPELLDLDVAPEIAAVNGASSCVVSGPTPAVDLLVERLESLDVPHVPLATSHAFHSAMMDDIVDEFAELVEGVDRSAPQTPYISNVSGDWITSAEATSPSYWAAHLRRPVRFHDCLTTLLDDGPTVILECGPGQALSGMARGSGAVAAIPGLRRDEDELAELRSAAARLWTVGLGDADAAHPAGSRVSLPHYPYQRARHWVDPDPEPIAQVAAPVAAAVATPVAAPAAPSPMVDGWFSVPGWRQAPRGTTPRSTSGTGWLVLADGPYGERMAERLQAFGEVSVLRRADVADAAAFAAHLERLGAVPERVVHAWGLDAWADPTGADDLAGVTELGFHALLELFRRLAEYGQEGVVVDVVTRGTWDVTGEGVHRPQLALLDGISAVAAHETGGVQVRRIDVTDEPDSAAADALLAELRTAPSEPVVALRGRLRWTRDVQPVEVAPLADRLDAVRSRGVYVVLGGSGGIGISLAEDLARTAQARLVLAFRSPLPPRVQWQDAAALSEPRVERTVRAIERMEAAGAEVLVVQADLSSETDLRRVRDVGLDRFGRIDGIVHAAGVPGGGLIEVKDRAVADAVLAPKVAGTLAMYRAFGDLDLDLVVLCTSVSFFGGDVGQVDYCAANGYQDAFARWAGGWARSVRSISWGAWNGVGMAVETEDLAAKVPGRQEPFDHPILTSKRVTVNSTTYAATVAPETHWFLDEHRSGGRPVVPGATYLELVRAGFEDSVPRPSADAVVELSEVFFTRPLSLDEGEQAELEVVLTRGGEGRAFETRTGDTVHAHGRVAWVSAPAEPPVDLDQVRDRCGSEKNGFNEEELAGAGWFRLGAHWRSLAGIREGDGERLGTFEPPSVVVDELAGLPLHPAVIDEITAFGGSSGHVPVGYGRLRIHAPLAPRMFSYVQYDGTRLYNADIQLCDEQGKVLVSIRDFVMSRVDGDTMGAALEPVDAAAEPVRLSTGMDPGDAVDAFYRAVVLDGAPHVIVSATPLARILRSGADEGAELRGEPVPAPAPISVPATPTVAAPAPEQVAAPAPVSADPPAATGGDGLLVTVAQLWSDVLGVEGIQPDDDFFELGGNSLVGVKLVAEVRKATGVKLPMRALFESSTVRDMVAAIEKLK